MAISQSVIATGITLIAKIQRQDALSIRKPPASGPITVATPVHAVHEPMAAPRSAGGNVWMISASVLGTSSAPAMPWRARAAISTSTVGATAHRAEVTPKLATPAAKTVRRSNRSSSDPPTRSSEDSVSA